VDVGLAQRHQWEGGLRQRATCKKRLPAVLKDRWVMNVVRTRVEKSCSGNGDEPMGAAACGPSPKGRGYLGAFGLGARDGENHHGAVVVAQRQQGALLIKVDCRDGVVGFVSRKQLPAPSPVVLPRRHRRLGQVACIPLHQPPRGGGEGPSAGLPTSFPWGLRMERRPLAPPTASRLPSWLQKASTDKRAVTWPVVLGSLVACPCRNEGNALAYILVVAASERVLHIQNHFAGAVGSVPHPQRHIIATACVQMRILPRARRSAAPRSYPPGSSEALFGGVGSQAPEFAWGVALAEAWAVSRYVDGQQLGIARARTRVRMMG
jgi:hypothetical protein